MLSDISIGIKTFLRDDNLFSAVDGIRRHLPECKMIIADDGEASESKEALYAEIISEGHTVLAFPFDVGFGYKSNRIARALSTSRLLVASDDFEFDVAAAAGVKRLDQVLDENPGLEIVSGRVNNRPYEFFLTERQPNEWYERTLKGSDYFHSVVSCDLTVNYSLIRGNVLVHPDVHWDDDVKIGGGEHGAFFVDVKKAGFRVAYVPGVNINEQEKRFGKEGPNGYAAHRMRARSAARPCFEKRGITKYVCGNGHVDWGR